MQQHATQLRKVVPKMSSRLAGSTPSCATVVHLTFVTQISEHDVRIVRTLGSGASGVVQKAFLPRESRFVAVSAGTPAGGGWALPETSSLDLPRRIVQLSHSPPAGVPDC